MRERIAWLLCWVLAASAVAFWYHANQIQGAAQQQRAAALEAVAAATEYETRYLVWLTKGLRLIREDDQHEGLRVLDGLLRTMVRDAETLELELSDDATAEVAAAKRYLTEVGDPFER